MFIEGNIGLMRTPVDNKWFNYKVEDVKGTVGIKLITKTLHWRNAELKASF